MNQKIIIEKTFKLALEYHQKNKLSEAEKFYKEILIIDPNHANAHNNLGLVYKNLGEFQKAIDCYQKAIQIQPNHANAHNNLGLVYKNLGEFQKAIDCYQKAIQIQPDYAGAYNNLGSLQKSLGEFQKAIDCYQKGLEYEPENLNYYYQLSNLEKKILNSSLKTKIVTIMKKNYLTKTNLAYGNFLLAKYEDHEKNYEKEFDYLLKGHQYYFESKEKNFRERIEYLLDIIPKIKELTSLDKLNQNTKEVGQKIKPIFIFGVPRCGSTLVEKIIASGRKYIPIGEETNIISSFVKENITSNAFKVDIEGSQKILFERYNQKCLVKKQNDYTFTDKSLNNFFYLGFIKKVFPDAKFINCKRNALSSIMSIIKNNLVDVAWSHKLGHIFKYFDIYYHITENMKKLFPDLIYELHYEELSNNPEVESKKLLEFCNLPWDISCLEFYKRKDIVSQTASNIQIRKAIYKDSMKKYLPFKQFLNKYGNKYSWFN